MLSSGILRRVALVRTDVTEERIASRIRVTRIAEIGIRLAVSSNKKYQVSISSQCASVASYC
jgi:hypothetical protein